MLKADFVDDFINSLKFLSFQWNYAGSIVDNIFQTNEKHLICKKYIMSVKIKYMKHSCFSIVLDAVYKFLSEPSGMKSYLYKNYCPYSSVQPKHSDKKKTKKKRGQ